MIISAAVIKRPRKQRNCHNCHKPIIGETLRLYGMADGDKFPYAVYLHPTCDQSKEVARKLASGTTTRAVDLLDSSAKSALVAQPANH
jgi:hypothetical protein